MLVFVTAVETVFHSALLRFDQGFLQTDDGNDDDHYVFKKVYGHDDGFNEADYDDDEALPDKGTWWWRF